ncbi:hypothetical protein ACLOJK_024788 [Asimina triloba]
MRETESCDTTVFPDAMREEEDHANWFSRWEEQLPTPEELTPITQSLITPDLALAFDIALATTPNPSPPPSSAAPPAPQQQPQPQPQPQPQSQSQSNPSSAHQPLHQLTPPNQPNASSADFGDSADLSVGAGGGVGGPDEPARTLKRPRLVWTPQLHKRFVDAVAHLGIKNAVPKTIMQLMSVDGLTRENVASHLQKYRLYLKRMQGLSGAGGAGGGGPVSPADAASDHLFASAPVPHHFLRAAGGPPPPPQPGEHFLPFVPVAALQHHHHQMAAAAAAAAVAQQQQQQQYQHQRHMGHFGSPPGGQFEHGFLARQQQAHHRMVGGPPPSPYTEDLDSGASGGGRKDLCDRVVWELKFVPSMLAAVYLCIITVEDIAVLSVVQSGKGWER